MVRKSYVITFLILAISFNISSNLFFFFLGCFITLVLGLKVSFKKDLTPEEKQEKTKQQIKTPSIEVNCKQILENRKKSEEKDLRKKNLYTLIKMPPEISTEHINQQLTQRKNTLFDILKNFSTIIDFLIINDITQIQFQNALDNETQKEVDLFKNSINKVENSVRRFVILNQVLENEFLEFQNVIKSKIQEILSKRKQFVANVKKSIAEFDSLTPEQKENQIIHHKLCAEQVSIKLKNLITDFEELIDNFYIDIFKIIDASFCHLTESSKENASPEKNPRKKSINSENVMIHVEKYYNVFRNKWDLLGEKDEQQKLILSSLNQINLLMESLQSILETSAKNLAKIFEEQEKIIADEVNYLEKIKEVFEKVNINLMSLKYQIKFSKGLENSPQNLLLSSFQLINLIMSHLFNFFTVRFNFHFTNVKVIFCNEQIMFPSDRKKSLINDSGEIAKILKTEDSDCESLDFLQKKMTNTFDFEHFINKYLQILFLEYSVNKYYKVD